MLCLFFFLIKKALSGLHKEPSFHKEPLLYKKPSLHKEPVTV